MTRFGKMSIFLELFFTGKGCFSSVIPRLFGMVLKSKSWYGDYLKKTTHKSIKLQKPETLSHILCNLLLGLGLTGWETLF